MHDEENTNIAACLKSLSHPRRVRILRLLALQPGGELSFSQIRKLTNLKPRALTHHLREMERV